mgnify:CR=1 FL=1
MKNKEMFKWIKKQCLLLPPEEYNTFHPYHIPIEQTVEIESGKKETRILKGEVQAHFVNHYRRVKSLWMSGGMIEVERYFKKRGFEVIKKQADVQEIQT